MRRLLQSTLQFIMGGAVSLSMVGAEIGKAGPLPSVHEILEEALRTIHPADIESLLKIARLQEKSGDRAAAAVSLKRIVEMAEATMSPADIRPRQALLPPTRPVMDYLLDVASLQAKLGDTAAGAMTLQLAFRGAKLEKRNADKVSALQDIALALLSIGDKDAASSTINHALQIAETLEDAPTRKVRLLAAVAVRQAELGDHETSKATLDQALQLAENVEWGAKAAALSDIAAAEARIADSSSARQTLEKALQILDAKGKTDLVLSYKVQAQIVVAEGLKAGGDHETAEKIIKQALQLVESIKDQSDRSSALRTIALAQARIGDIDGALQSEKAIVEEMYKGLSFPYIADAQIEKGDLTGALKTANSIGEFDPLRKEFVLAHIAVAYARTGNVMDATTISKQIDHPFRASALKAIGEAMAKAGHADQALAWASREAHALEKAHILMGIAEGLVGQHKGRNDSRL